MDYIKKYYADVKSATEMDAFRKRNGILLLPLGCYEMHGPYASMSCDTFVAEAVSCILAEDWNGLVMPPIHYSYPGASAPWPGTVDISPEVTSAYVKEVVTAIMRQGFERLVLVNLHFPNRPNLAQVMRSVFRDTGQVPVLFEINYGEYLNRVQKEWGKPHGEALMMLSALYLLGRHGQWDPAAGGDTTLEGPKWPTETTFALRKRGTEFGYYFHKPENHVGYYPGLTLDDAEKGAKILKEITLSTGHGLDQDYAAVLEETKQLFKEKPWEKI